MEELYMFYIDEEDCSLNITEPTNQIFTTKENAFWYYTYLYLNVPDFQHMNCYLKVYRKNDVDDYIYTSEVIKLFVPQGTVERIFKRYLNYLHYTERCQIELHDNYNCKDFSQKKFREKKYI